jgi:hypothetical protein
MAAYAGLMKKSKSAEADTLISTLYTPGSIPFGKM